MKNEALNRSLAFQIQRIVNKAVENGYTKKTVLKALRWAIEYIELHWEA